MACTSAPSKMEGGQKFFEKNLLGRDKTILIWKGISILIWWGTQACLSKINISSEIWKNSLIMHQNITRKPPHDHHLNPSRPNPGSREKN